MACAGRHSRVRRAGAASKHGTRPQLQRLSQGLFRKDLNADAATPWMGFRPSLPDSLPVIDQVCDGKVLLAFGHQHLGLTQAALTAELIGQMVSGAALALPSVDAYRLARF